LLRDDRPVRLGGRPLDVLCALASAGGDVVSKDELMTWLWAGRVVEEGNIYVDNWNSLSSAREFETQLDQTRSRIRLIDQYCGEIGRDPTSLRRSYLMFDANARLSGGLFGYYESPKIFTDMVRRVIDLGITEIGVYYPPRAEQIPTFEKIAAEVIPLLKSEHTAHVGH